MPCQQYNNLITNAPLITKGFETYNRCQTVKRICMIIAYNMLPDTKPKLNFKQDMKPLTTKGEQKSKFHPLTPAELKMCYEEAERYINAIKIIERAEEYAEQKRHQIKVEVAENIAHEKQTTNEQEIEIKAIQFLKNNPMDTIKKEYFKLHKGDEDALHMVIWAYCYKWMEDAPDEGLHVIAIGTRGTGKSHGIVSAMKFLPPELTISAGISARSLYYKKDIPVGTTIYLDELPTDQNLIDSLKTIITYYPNGGKRIVTYNQDTLELSTPARLTINTSTVDQTADEQFTNRMCVIRPNDDESAKKDRIDFRIGLYSGNVERVNEELLVEIRNALRYLSTRTFDVKFPTGAIECDDYKHVDMRIFNQFCGAVIGNTILNFPARQFKETEDGKIEVIVSEEDFNAVIHLYQNPNEYYLKLTPSAAMIKDMLERIFPQHLTVGEIAERTKLSTQTVRNTITGRKDRPIESLMGAGYVEEVGYNERIGEHGPSLSYKVYRSTRGIKETSSPSPAVKAKKGESTQSTMGSIVGMLRWNQNRVNENQNASKNTQSEQTKQTTANQHMVC